MAQIHEDFSRDQELKTPSNRAFGLVFVAVFLIVALWPLAFGDAPRWWSLIVSALVAAVTIMAPVLLNVPNRLWLRLGLLLNRIVSPVVIGVMFYVVVTPMGVLMRLLGKDVLRLRREQREASYWVKREPPGPKPDSLIHQF